MRVHGSGGFGAPPKMKGERPDYRSDVAQAMLEQFGHMVDNLNRLRNEAMDRRQRAEDEAGVLARLTEKIAAMLGELENRPAMEAPGPEPDDLDLS